jgi:hypothetical protein
MTVQKRRGRKSATGASFFRPAVIVGTGALIGMLALGPLTITTASAAPGDTITGIAWQDFSGDGKKETTDPVLPGILVKAVDDAGNETAAVTTGADGSYTLTLPSNGARWRVVATIPTTPEWAEWREGYIGPDNGSTVQFASPGATNVNFSFQVPDYYMDYNPLVYTPIARFGALNGVNGTRNAGAAVPFDATVQPANPASNPQKNAFEYNASVWQVPHSEVGSTLGSAWLRSSEQNGVGRLFVGSYLKTHVALGPGGIGAIYEVTPDDGTKTSPTASGSLLVDLAALGIDVGESGRANEAAMTDADYLNEATARLPYIGRNGLGGMTLSNDGKTLYTINLKNRSLISIDISGGAVTAADVTETEWDSYFPDGSDLRPFGLTTDPTTNEILLTVTKTAETSQDASQTGVQVYRFTDAAPATLNLVMDQNIGTLQATPGGSVEISRTQSPWIADADGLKWDSPIQASAPTTNQYIASDIEIVRGDLVLGFRNLTGDQLGDMDPITSNGVTRVTAKIATGIIVAATPSGDGTYSVPDWNNYDDSWPSVAGNDVYVIRGQSQGSMVAVQSRPDGILTSGVHVGGGTFQTGLRRIDVTTNKYVDGAGPILNQQNLGELGKANGLGSISALAGNAPIEIGNRVWLDIDGDGVQDPSEVPLEGVTVRLLDANGVVVATKTTDANGVYVFRSDTDGVLPNTDYIVEFDKSTTVITPAISDLGVTDLSLLKLTTQTAGGDALIDSNPDVTTGRAPVTTKGSGENDHSIDAGYNILPPTPVLPVLGLDKKVLLAGETVEGAPAQSDTLYANGVPVPRAVAPGDLIRYVLTVRAAASGSVAEDVTVEDKLPRGLQLQSYTSTLNGAAATQTYANDVWTIGDMKPGDVAQLIVTARVGTLTPQNQQVTNVAQLAVSGVDVADVPELNPGRDGGRNTDPSDGYDEVDIIVDEPEEPGSPGTSSPGTATVGTTTPGTTTVGTTTPGTTTVGTTTPGTTTVGTTTPGTTTVGTTTPGTTTVGTTTPGTTTVGTTTPGTTTVGTTTPGTTTVGTTTPGTTTVGTTDPGTTTVGTTTPGTTTVGTTTPGTTTVGTTTPGTTTVGTTDPGTTTVGTTTPGTTTVGTTTPGTTTVGTTTPGTTTPGTTTVGTTTPGTTTVGTTTPGTTTVGTTDPGTTTVGTTTPGTTTVGTTTPGTTTVGTTDPGTTTVGTTDPGTTTVGTTTPGTTTVGTTTPGTTTPGTTTVGTTDPGTTTVGTTTPGTTTVGTTTPGTTTVGTTTPGTTTVGTTTPGTTTVGTTDPGTTTVGTTTPGTTTVGTTDPGTTTVGTTTPGTTSVGTTTVGTTTPGTTTVGTTTPGTTTVGTTTPGTTTVGTTTPGTTTVGTTTPGTTTVGTTDPGTTTVGTTTVGTTTPGTTTVGTTTPGTTTVGTTTPGTTTVGTTTPGTTTVGTTTPGTTTVGTTDPGTTTVGTTTPGTTTVGTTTPGTTTVGTTDPGTTTVGTTTPGTTTPGTTTVGTTTPGTTTVGTTDPGTTTVGTTTPGTTTVGTTTPGTTTVGTTDPGTTTVGTTTPGTTTVGTTTPGTTTVGTTTPGTTTVGTTTPGTTTVGTTTPGTTTVGTTTPGTTTVGTTTPGTTTVGTTTPGTTTVGTTTPGTATPGTATPGTGTPGTAASGGGIVSPSAGTSGTSNPAGSSAGSNSGSSGHGSDNLASTGAGDTAPLTIAGLLALAAGAVFALLGWRRRASRSSLEG